MDNTVRSVRLQTTRPTILWLHSPLLQESRYDVALGNLLKHFGSLSLARSLSLALMKNLWSGAVFRDTVPVSVTWDRERDSALWIRISGILAASVVWGWLVNRWCFSCTAPPFIQYGLAQILSAAVCSCIFQLLKKVMQIMFARGVKDLLGPTWFT